MAPPARPCRARVTIIISKVVESPVRIEAAMNTTVAAMKNGRVPHIFEK